MAHALGHAPCQQATGERRLGEDKMRHAIGMIATALAISAFWTADALAEPAELFERLFGGAIRLDPDIHRQVREGEPGKRHYVDHDGDGRPEEVWFIDTDTRHPEGRRPVLVRVIDEDGDLEAGDEPDYDSDLYLADWNADGTVNVVCDYTDRTGANEVSEMAFYFPRGESVMCWYGEDVGDDNLLWYDAAYTYDQRLCQGRTHFGGDELFCAFVLEPGSPEWVPQWENPFTFYDHDHDGVTEEVIRIEGTGNVVKNLRYSFDADNDATWDQPRDFDVSVTAHAGEGQGFDLRYATRRVLRGVPTGPFLAYHTVPGFAIETRWDKRMLTWDEIDRNVDRDGAADTMERWEGVIAKGNEAFPQVGGPSSGPFNNRFELAGSPGLIRLYYAPVDQRLHLLGAETIWLAADPNHDGTADMRYTYTDSDGDGRIDVWELDADGDGTADDRWTSTAECTDVAYNWGQVQAMMIPVLETAPGQLFVLASRLREALVAKGGSGGDPVWALVDSDFAAEAIREEFREDYLQSNESLRFYLDIVKDRLILALKRAHDDPGFWERFNAMRGAGDLEGMRGLVEKTFTITTAAPDFGEWRASRLAAFARPKVAWAQDWVPPNIGWESELAGYRVYWGQFDFFGKQQRALVMPAFGNGASYHAEQPWGMDALHVNQTGGLGAVTLYASGQAYPVYSPEGKGAIVWSKRFISMDDASVTVEVTAENVGPQEAPYTVRFTCSALADRPDSPIEVVVDGGPADVPIELGIGITRMAQETFAIDTAAGVMGSWGVQGTDIGWIGLGVVFPPKLFVRAMDSEAEHEVILAAKAGVPLRYHIQGDWLRGRTFPRSPVLRNWMDDLRRTALNAKLR